MTKKIKVKKLEPGAGLMFNEQGDWIDIITPRQVHARKGFLCHVNLGIAIELPKGYEAIMAPRSSTFRKYGLLLGNSIGVIDHSFCGDDDEWQADFYATKDIDIAPGTRLLQFRIQKNQPAVKAVYVETLGNSNRGGFGSTGV